MSDYDKSIHSNPDAQAWAKFFISTVEEQSWRIEDIDESLMTGWFANAMMAMHDHVKKEWVGLSDEEIESCNKFTTDWGQSTVWLWNDDFEEGGIQFARAIEAKLKEKNNA